ncbi:hypothetical protein BDN72DRAFT_900421 [Pluteus cervinus]|uniref:Uncharacterized protein n=1 Tax=Pluteus cervinus TaxID=181527 RepID=A0ACD3AIL9_9AGAR|nr:hypothetical protein BDN72DRAFT_900421 [Pluteus cervinus]
MAPVKKALPLEFELDDVSGKVRCLICKEADPSGLGLWIDRRSAKKHLESETHQTEVFRKDERERQQAHDKARLERLRQAPLAPSQTEAPSRDIATKFASMDRLKHILSGGYWKHDGKWVQAGQDVQKILKSEPIIQRHLGWVPEHGSEPGQIYLPGKSKLKICDWGHTLASTVTVAESEFADIDSAQRWSLPCGIYKLKIS